MNNLSVAKRLDLKLAEINEKLRNLGVPFSLNRLGNYRDGEWQIQDVLAHFSQKKFKIAVCFVVLTPYTGVETEYWCQFNRTYSKEAFSGQIIVPVVNQKYFLMMKAYGTFIGMAPLVFPRGFIPETKRDLSAVEVTSHIIDRKMGEVVEAVNAKVTVSPYLLKNQGKSLRLAEDSSTSGNWLTVATLSFEMDIEKFQSRGRKYRQYKLVEINDFLKLVSDGEILDAHSLSAFVLYSAVNRSTGG